MVSPRNTWEKAPACASAGREFDSGKAHNDCGQSATQEPITPITTDGDGWLEATRSVAASAARVRPSVLAWLFPVLGAGGWLRTEGMASGPLPWPRSPDF